MVRTVVIPSDIRSLVASLVNKNRKNLDLQCFDTLLFWGKISFITLLLIESLLSQKETQEMTTNSIHGPYTCSHTSQAKDRIS